MRTALAKLDRLEEQMEAQVRPTALLWAWPTVPERAISAHWGVTFLGGGERERGRLLAQLRCDPTLQAPPDPLALPKGRRGLVVIPYVPRPLQLDLHRRRQRLTVLVKHRRFGGSTWAVAELARAACEHPGPALYAFVAPFRHQVKAVAWDTVKRLLEAVPGVSFNESELRVELPASRRLVLLGADNPDAIRGIGLDGVALDEYGYADPEVFGRVIRPALADRGGFAIFTGTPNGRNAFAELYDRAAADPEACAVLYKASTSGVLSAAELEAARTDMSPDEYAQEFEGAFEGGVRGSYYGALIDEMRATGRIRPLAEQPEVRVDTAWDLGLADSTAIVFWQSIGHEVHIIDYLEGSGESLRFWVREVERKRYLYGTHWLPPDAAAREYSSGESRVDLAKRLGLRPVRLVPQVDVETGIERVRLCLPRCWVDGERCRRLLDVLSAYRKAWDAKRQVYHRHPEHDWSSHGADAIRYMAIVLGREAQHTRRDLQSRPRQARIDFDVFRPQRGGGDFGNFFKPKSAKLD